MRAFGVRARRALAKHTLYASNPSRQKQFNPCSCCAYDGVTPELQALFEPRTRLEQEINLFAKPSAVRSQDSRTRRSSQSVSLTTSLLRAPPDRDARDRAGRPVSVAPRRPWDPDGWRSERPAFAPASWQNGPGPAPHRGSRRLGRGRRPWGAGQTGRARDRGRGTTGQVPPLQA